MRKRSYLEMEQNPAQTFVESVVGQTHNPDVLSCLANLSNDEVFTPPDVVNQILDALPQELFSNPNTTFLDPACKSGVFLREIAKRLIRGLEKAIPDLSERLDHIYKKQLFGIAITELTSLVARRTLYCSLRADSEYSIAKFDKPEGNIRFQSTEHQWVDGKCAICGAAEAEFGKKARRENKDNHAYEFIHHKNPKEIFNVNFDVIVGNPPYQISDGGAQASASPLYDKFIEQAKKLNPDFLTMIIPARWYAGGKGVDDFRDTMLHDDKICKLVDFPDSSKCFTGQVQIKGGVCYFLRANKHHGKCEVVSFRNDIPSTSSRRLLEDGMDTFIRYNEAVSILHKVRSWKEPSVVSLVSSLKPFGLRTYVKGSDKKSSDSIILYANKHVGYIDRKEIKTNLEIVYKYKIFISRAYGAGEGFPHQILNVPILGNPGTCCTETYLFIGPFETKKEATNFITYIHSKLFRFLVLLIKNTQDAPKRVYKCVPMQDFSKPWTDEELYKKYNLTDEEIAFIESMIRPME